MKPLLNRSKAAILGLLTICAGLAVWLLCPSDPPVWRLRTIFHIGTTADPTPIVEGLPLQQGTVERYAAVVALISDAGFRQIIAGTSEFEPNSAARSKRLVFETLRPHALNDNDIEIDVSAASAADCRSAYRNIAGKILQRHALLFDQKAKLLQAAIDNLQERSIQLKKWEDAELQLGRQASPDADHRKSDLRGSWDKAREHLLQLEAIKSLVKSTTFPPETEVYVEGPLSNNTMRLSAFAGLGVIFFALMLGLGLESYPSKPRKTEI